MKTPAIQEITSYTGTELLEAAKLSKLKYLVVGTGRSGTVYMAKLLSSIGISCTHEAIFKNDGLEAAKQRLSGEKPLEISPISKYASVVEESEGRYWFKKGGLQKIEAESSYMAAPFIQDESLKDVTIIHAVRHPMKVINSFVNGLLYFQDWCLRKPEYEEYHKFIMKYVPNLYDPPTPLLRAALYWVEWNEMIERLCKGKNHFLFRVEHKPDKLIRYLGKNPKTGYYSNKKANEKLGLEEKYTSFYQIPDETIRRRVVALFNRYYNILI